MSRLMVSMATLGCLVGTAASAQTAVMDRMKGGNTIEANLEFAIGVFRTDNPNDSDTTPLRTDLFIAGGGESAGGYAQMAFASLFGINSAGNSISAAQISNIEIGGYGNFSIGPLSLVPRLGLVIPVIDPDLEGALAIVGATTARLTDTALFNPDTLTIRPSLSLLAEFGLIAIRADLGFDIGVGTADLPGIGSERTTSIRLNLSVAVRVTLLHIAVEFANVGALNTIGGIDADIADRFVHNLSFVVALQTPWIKPYIAVTLPLDVVDDLTFITMGINASM